MTAVLRVALVLGVLGFAVPFVMPSQPTRAQEGAEGARLLTYKEARAAGLYPYSLPSLTGLPACPNPEPPDSGFGSAAEATAAAARAEDAPRCAMPPAATLYVQTVPVPGPQGYRHTGEQSLAPFGDGLRAALEIPNPSVPGGAVSNFMAGRLLAKPCRSCGYSTWTEAGWMKNNLIVNAGYAKPCVYALNGRDRLLQVYCGLDLRVGRTYVFELEGMEDAVQASLLWNGTWHVLEKNVGQTCEGPVDGRPMCNWEALLEAYTTSGTGFDIRGDSYAGPGTSFENLSFRARDEGSWHRWESRWHGARVEVRDPYVSCAAAGREWHEFVVRRATTCGATG
jgi:hypothetical protein